MIDYNLVEKHRLEFDNMVIDYINRGFTKSEARNQAYERLLNSIDDEE